MIEKLKKDLINEKKHLNFYLSNASQFVGLHAHEYKEIFIEAAKSELEHVVAFQDLIIGLENSNYALKNDNVLPLANPKVENFNEPYASYFYTYPDAERALQAAVRMEEEVVANYIGRQKDAQELAILDPINGAWIDIFLDSQIQDSRQDADKMKQLLRKVD